MVRYAWTTGPDHAQECPAFPVIQVFNDRPRQDEAVAVYSATFDLKNYLGYRRGAATPPRAAYQTQKYALLRREFLGKYTTKAVPSSTKHIPVAAGTRLKQPIAFFDILLGNNTARPAFFLPGLLNPWGTLNAT